MTLKFDQPSLLDGFKPLSPRVAYNLVAREYDSWHWQEFWRRNEAPLVRKLLGRDIRGMRALDIGAGTGFYMSSLVEHGVNVAGIDISENMLSVARERLGRAALLIQGEAEALPIRRESIDIALAIRVMSHVRDLQLALREVARVLPAGGRLVITDVHPSHDYRATRVPINGRMIYIDTYKWTPEQVIVAAHEAGLVFKRGRRLTAKNLRWTPEGEAFASIDRTGSRPIGHLLLFRRTRAQRDFIPGQWRHSSTRGVYPSPPAN